MGRQPRSRSRPSPTPSPSPTRRSGHTRHPHPRSRSRSASSSAASSYIAHSRSPSPPRRSSSRRDYRSPSSSISSAAPAASSSQHHRRHTGDTTSKGSFFAGSAGLLAGIGVAAVLAHNYWPKGILYGASEDWEKAPAKPPTRQNRSMKDDPRSGSRRPDQGYNAGNAGLAPLPSPAAPRALPPPPSSYSREQPLPLPAAGAATSHIGPRSGDDGKSYRDAPPRLEERPRTSAVPYQKDFLDDRYERNRARGDRRSLLVKDEYVPRVAESAHHDDRDYDYERERAPRRGKSEDGRRRRFDGPDDYERRDAGYDHGKRDVYDVRGRWSNGGGDDYDRRSTYDGRGRISNAGHDYDRWDAYDGRGGARDFRDNRDQLDYRDRLYPDSRYLVAREPSPR